MPVADVEYPQVALLVLVVVVALALVWGLSTSTVALGPYNDDWDGGSDLRTELGASGASVALGTSIDAYESGPPSRTVAVVLDPRDRYPPGASARLAAFVSRGGTLVVASGDNRTNDLLDGVGATARIDGLPVRDERSNDEDPALPRATNVADHEFTRDVDALTLNHGSTLEPGDATPLVNTSVLAYVDRNRNEELDENETLAERTVATVESVGAGQVVLVSDESVFTNAMLEREGNRRFVRTLPVDRDRALVDYSHGEPLPPLSYLLLRVRASPLLAAVLGVGAVGAVLVLGRLGGLAGLARLGGRSADADAPEIPGDEATIARYVSRRNPSWDDARVRRVTEAIIRARDIGGDDD